MVTNKKRFRDLFNPTLGKACLVFSQPVADTRLHLQIKRPRVFSPARVLLENQGTRFAAGR